MNFLPQIFRRTPKPSTDITTNVVESAVGRGKDSPAVKYQVRSVVSAGLEIRGDLVAREGAVVDGTVLGNVTIESATAALLVRRTGRVVGNISGAQVLIAGEVVGNISGRFVRLYPGSRVFGKVSATRLLVDDGAVIDNESIKVEASDHAAASNVAQLRSADVARERMPQIIHAAAMIPR